MSFTKTISVVAALASIFGAGAAGWKLAQDGNQQPKIYEERIQQLEEQLKQQPITTIPAPVTLPPAQTQVPQATQLPPPPPPVPPEQVTTSTP